MAKTKQEIKVSTKGNKPKIEIINVRKYNYYPNQVAHKLPSLRQLRDEIIQEYGPDSVEAFRARYAVGWMVGLSETLEKRRAEAKTADKTIV